VGSVDVELGHNDDHGDFDFDGGAGIYMSDVSDHEGDGHDVEDHFVLARETLVDDDDDDSEFDQEDDIGGLQIDWNDAR
jgi:hypothetical protein